MENHNKKYLSASRVKTLESCSWIYWCKYNLKLPDKSNDGASRGSICHLIFEVLINKKRKKYYNKLLKIKKLSSIPSIDRLVNKWIKKYNLSQNDYLSVEKMIIVGLQTDFYGKDDGKSEVLSPEFEFKIENITPEYNISGLIDKIFLYPEDKKITITDYKSSKEKFKGDEKDCNVQGLMYSLVASKNWPEYTNIIVKFIFLKFPEDPMIELSFAKEEIEGFEHYLEFLNKKINNFSEKLAKSAFAADAADSEEEFKGKKMCGRAYKKNQLKKDGTPMWHCSFKFDFDYYVLLDKDKKIIKSSFEESPLLKDIKEGLEVEKRYYAGCPKYLISNSQISQKQDIDNFGI